MRAVLRFGLVMLAAMLTIAAPPALAQTIPETSTNTPAADSIGPRELQNFSLNGTVTREADTPPPAPTPSARSQATAPTQRNTPPTSAQTASVAPAIGARDVTRSAGAADAPAAASGQSLMLDLPSAGTVLPSNVAQPGFAAPSDSAPATFAPEQELPLWPWLALAGVLGGAAAFLLLRRRSRAAVAGGPAIDAFVAPEPAPSPRPAPVPSPVPKAPAPKPAGIVSTRLRPWVEIAFVPLACAVDDERVTVDFEVQLHNSGGAPARDILVEASMFNAGPTQEQDIGAFFAKPLGQGERIQALPPLQNVAIRSSLVAPRANIQIFEMAGKQVFVPLVAFNALYSLSSGTGQTSVAYLLGRDTKGEKLGPLRVDLGSRAFTGLGVRPLPIGVRS